MSSACLTVLVLIFINVNLSLTEKCLKSDMMYKYTECDNFGQRWLVSVPNNSKVCDKDSEFLIPKKARDCGNPCDPGTFLDMETQECKDCQSGTYSQSATTEIDSWRQMPTGFYSFSIGYEDGNCTSENWMAKGDFLATSVSKCETHLYYTVSLFKAGELVFEYQNPEEDLIFAVKISNDNCQSTVTNQQNMDVVRYLDPTGASAWKKITIDLKKGSNMIRWVVVGLETHVSTVKIKYLKITNTIFTSYCIPCTEGYFSSSRSSKCTPCPMNKYTDNPGSSQCNDCPVDKYSFPGSKSCADRPSCGRADYSYKWTACDLQHKRQKIYYWIEPQLCSETKPGSVKLPAKSDLENCSPCPAGTELNVSSNSCEFCPVGTASTKPGEKCTKCAPNTKPISEILFNQWSHQLPNLSFRCLKINKDCNSSETWIFNGDNIQSSPAFDINLLQLNFDIIPGRNSSADETLTSRFSFDFSMKCSGYCVLHLFLKNSKSSTMRISRWVNSTDRQTFNYNIPREDIGQLIWFFSRSKDYKISQKTNDYLRIYSIKLTKVKNVGAIRCQYCNPNSPSTECTDCGKGKYFSQKSQKCIGCPDGQILKSGAGGTIGNCIKCGDGLMAINSSICLPDMHYISKNKNHYDLTQLAGSHVVQGSSLFTTHGQQYKHLFNVTLFSNNGILSICKNNVTSYEENLYEVPGPMCRLTLVSNKLQNGTIYAMQSIQMADQFIDVRQSNSSIEYWKHMNESLISKGFPGDGSGMDLHFHMKSERKTENCKAGYGTVLSLRCDSSVTSKQLLLPPKCPTETCDGCNFHFLLISRYACAECRLEDYTVLTEECYNGMQTRHYRNPNYCIPPPGFHDKVNIRCPLFTTRMEIGVITTGIVLVFLLSLVIYCYKKNKKLEYKYMRLVGGNDDNENVLNGAESCGMHDDEDEDEDDVKLKTNSKSGKVFAKYNKPSQYRNDKNYMERINLNENPDFDI